MIRPHPTTTSPAGFSAALGATVLWGIGNVAIARAPIGGLSLAFHRLWIAAVLYGFVLYATGGRLTARSFKYGMPGAIAFAADIGTFFLAIKNTTVADAVTISALQPVVILFVAGALFGEKVRARHVVCTIVAIIGVAAVVRGSSSSGGATIFGEVMAVAALFAWAWYFIASKQARQHLDTLEYLTVVMIGGLPIIAPFALISGELADTTMSWETFGWVMLVVLLPGSGHILINWAHGHSTIVSSSLLTLLMPVISTAGAAMWLDQPVTSIQVIGIGVVLSALAIVIVGDARAASLDAESLEEGPRV
ncbi:MAG TPA: DMT family transporter [Microthrixaceae bacterium]|nr:DMT family transporter [Microthrixaceae bacterium]